MTAGSVATGGPPAAPRPGIAKTLGVMNIVFAVILAGYALWTGLMVMAMALREEPGDAASAPSTKVETTLAALTVPEMIRFGVIELATSIPLQVLMFATGIGLVNLRRWGATWWARGCWAKIVRLVVVWAYFLFGVVPPLSSGMARSVVAMFRDQKGAVAARTPTVEQLTLVYSVMFSVVGVTMIVGGLLYPAVSLWLLGRPGVKAALSPSPSPDPDPATESSPP